MKYEYNQLLQKTSEKINQQLQQYQQNQNQQYFQGKEQLQELNRQITQLVNTATPCEGIISNYINVQSSKQLLQLAKQQKEYEISQMQTNVSNLNQSADRLHDQILNSNELIDGINDNARSTRGQITYVDDNLSKFNKCVKKDIACWLITLDIVLFALLILFSVLISKY